MGSKILIFGAAGSVGSELYRQLVDSNTILAVDINETALFDLHEEYAQKGKDVSFRIGDIRDRQVVREIFDSFTPATIFICSALKHVYPNELFPEEAVKTNVLGTINIVNEAKSRKVPKVVYISTDKVINSNSIMGVTKRLGELVTRNAGYTAVRFGNVLGSRGSVLPIWQRQIDKGEALTVTDSRAERYFMSIEEACRLVIKASEIGKGGEVIVMDMGKKKNVLELAKEILGKSGKEENIKMIGLRPGETLSEDIMTNEEITRSEKLEEFYIIR